jgi:hypothetical protein
MAKMTLMRKLFLTGIILSITLITTAQGRFGMKAGPNYFLLKSDNSKTSDYSSGKIGLLAGLSYELNLGSGFALQPEFNLSVQHAQEDYYGTDISMSYFQVPFLLKYNIKNSKVALYTGPQFGFLNKADYTKANGTPGASTDFVQTDFGVTLGVGHVPNNPGISFDVRVYQGLSNVLKSEYNDGIKTRPFIAAVTIGYVWGTRK